MCDNHQKCRVYQLDFEKSLVQEPLDPRHSSEEDYRFHKCIPLKGERRQEAVRDLVSLFPEGVLVQDSPDSIRYCLDRFQLNGLWLRKIMAQVHELNEKNVSWAAGPSAALVRCIQNPLDTGYMFCVQALPFCWTAYPSSVFLRALSVLEKGECLYVGSVLECL